MSRHVPVSEFVREVLPDIDDPPVKPLTQERLNEFWRNEAGVFARNCHPILFQSGRLAILCESPVWATQLRNMVPSLTRQLNESGFEIGTIDVKTSPDPGIPKPKRGNYQRAKGISEPSARALSAQSRCTTHSGLSAALERLSRKTAGSNKDRKD